MRILAEYLAPSRIENYYRYNSSIHFIRDVRNEKPILKLMFLRHARFLLEILQTLRIQDTSLMMRSRHEGKKGGTKEAGKIT